MRHDVIDLTVPGAVEHHEWWCADTYGAVAVAIHLMGERAGKMTVRPLVERTAMEGRARWPLQLHKLASHEARQGWERASQLSWLHYVHSVMYTRRVTVEAMTLRQGVPC